mmetsp:Transcript_9373/g.12246  ORF Transcript_9373/g.12246 Transcript_9373/m.12246 type:complete len:260 (+) Transcript_9373:197-976(+)
MGASQIENGEKNTCCAEYCDNCGANCCSTYWSKWYGDVKTEDIVVPRFERISVTQLFYMRCGFIVFGIATIIFDWSIQYEPEFYFCYATNWAWLLFCAYFICAVIVTRRFLKEGKSEPPTTLEKVTAVLFPISWSMAFTVTILYWVLIFSEDDVRFPYFLLMLIVHFLNLILATTDLFMHRVQFQWVQAPVMIVIGILYLSTNFACSQGNEENVYGDTLVFYPTENITSDSFVVIGMGLTLMQASFFIGVFVVWLREKL